MAADRIGLKDEQPKRFWSSRKLVNQLVEQRTLKSWIQLLIFYLAFYFVLTVLTVFMFLIFYQMIDQRAPNLRNGESALGSLETHNDSFERYFFDHSHSSIFMFK